MKFLQRRRINPSTFGGALLTATPSAFAADPVLNFVTNLAQWAVILGGVYLVVQYVNYGRQRAGGHGSHGADEKLEGLIWGTIFVLAAQAIVSLFKSWL